MLTFDAWRFPDGETHLPAQLARWNHRIDGRLTYQYPIYEQAIHACGLRCSTAIDVGAHVGLWSYFMTRDFARVIAFEPIAEHRLCWLANVPSRPRDALYPCALGAKAGSVGFARPEASSSRAFVDGPGPIPMRTLDSFDLEADLLKIDCEGYELEVLEGAFDLLSFCRPVVAIEQRPKQTARFHHGRYEAIRFLRGFGGQVVWQDGHDYVVRLSR